MNYKCYNCQRSYDNVEVSCLCICCVCDRVFCGNCPHFHFISINSKGESLKLIVKNKATYAYHSCLQRFDFDELGYPPNFITIEVHDFDQVNINREIIKPYRTIQYTGILDFKEFEKNIIKMKTRFLYQLYKMLLNNKFCIDITEKILEFL